MLRFRLLRHIAGIGIKANVWGEIFSSKRLLRDENSMLKKNIEIKRHNRW